MFELPDAKRRRQYRLQPWLWRDDWANGRVTSRYPESPLPLWVLDAGLAATFLIALALGAPVVIPVIFGFSAIIATVACIRLTRDYRKFGQSVFEMALVEVALGGELSGRIRARFDAPPQAGVQVKLSNIQCTHTSSDSGPNDEAILWWEERIVQPTRVEPGPGEWSIPVSFPIPPDWIETGDNSFWQWHIWRLEARADCPRQTFRAQFEVPVAKPAPVASPIAERSAPPVPFEISTGNMRDWLGIVVVVTFCLSVGLGVALPSSFDWDTTGPITVTVIFGSLTIAAIAVWLSSSRVVIERGEARSESSLLGFRRSRSLPLADIIDVTVAVASTVNEKDLYRIYLIGREGKEIFTAGAIPKREEAERIAAEIRHAVGIS